MTPALRLTILTKHGYYKTNQNSSGVLIACYFMESKTYKVPYNSKSITIHTKILKAPFIKILEFCLTEIYMYFRLDK